LKEIKGGVKMNEIDKVLISLGFDSSKKGYRDLKKVLEYIAANDFEYVSIIKAYQECGGITVERNIRYILKENYNNLRDNFYYKGKNTNKNIIYWLAYYVYSHIN
jgi:hypothetical protein